MISDKLWVDDEIHLQVFSSRLLPHIAYTVQPPAVCPKATPLGNKSVLSVQRKISFASDGLLDCIEILFDPCAGTNG